MRDRGGVGGGGESIKMWKIMVDPSRQCRCAPYNLPEKCNGNHALGR